MKSFISRCFYCKNKTKYYSLKKKIKPRIFCSLECKGLHLESKKLIENRFEILDL